ncbi:phosphoribosylglycinamide formyltransferase [Thermoactinomyces sp. AMNI-1]|uniref:Phosphoribosylglycinamide formyltransferase n=2 Tax=Thermoactinomyces mirandus TaxID=2756294 RepID=A0A7W1XPT0_9BACL|nr:phosphoribosylglycinamide formyltransferase [Thermoactinomyces mirandus]
MGIAVFASGNGSNFEVLVNHSRQNKWIYPISLLVCDRPGAGVLKRAERLNIPVLSESPKQYPDKGAYEKRILEHLKAHQIKRIVLAGYMRLIGPTLLEAYPDQIINIHPSLLPAFPGKNAIEKAFVHPVCVSGVTVHLVDQGMDTGPILAQVPVEIERGDTLEIFEQKIHQAEHRLYPETVQKWIAGEIGLRRVEMKHHEEGKN